MTDVIEQLWQRLVAQDAPAQADRAASSWVDRTGDTPPAMRAGDAPKDYEAVAAHMAARGCDTTARLLLGCTEISTNPEDYKSASSGATLHQYRYPLY